MYYNRWTQRRRDCLPGMLNGWMNVNKLFNNKITHSPQVQKTMCNKIVKKFYISCHIFQVFHTTVWYDTVRSDFDDTMMCSDIILEFLYILAAFFTGYIAGVFKSIKTKMAVSRVFVNVKKYYLWLIHECVKVVRNKHYCLKSYTTFPIHVYRENRHICVIHFFQTLYRGFSGKKR